MKESDMDLRVASWLFRNLGSVINKRGDNGNTLLHEAASANDVVLIEFLIKKGADLEILNDNGYTPLKKAFMRGNMDALKCFLKMVLIQLLWILLAGHYCMQLFVVMSMKQHKCCSKKVRIPKQRPSRMAKQFWNLRRTIK